MEAKLKKLKQEMELQYFQETEFSEKEKEKIRKAVKGKSPNRILSWAPSFFTFAFAITIMFVLGQYVYETISKQESQLQAGDEEMYVDQEKPSINVERITKDGGYYDSIQFLDMNMKTIVGGVYQDAFMKDNVKVICRFIDYHDRCGDPYFFLVNDANTIEEAYIMLKDHLPTDVVKTNEVDLAHKGVVYDFYSEDLEKIVPGKNGNFHIVFKINPEGKIFAATTGLGTYENKKGN
ncbi:hypothetical protein ACLM5H_08085 [Fredinandcohnia humi]